MSEIKAQGMSISKGVVEAIVQAAANKVDGVKEVPQGTREGVIGALFNQPSVRGVELYMDDVDQLTVDVHISVAYNKRFNEIANELRKAINKALMLQIGIEASEINVYVDGIVFKN
ncbi:MAG: Asp23/Gls24 family envelope stress response protein [Eggerthellaceae bacterium]|nr:Asp23/Gls24 family envelope stress response protein [Eggerthellaceae bacterium]